MSAAIEGGNPVAISCMAGYGRSGTLLACYLVFRGRSDSEAIRHLIFKRPCSAEMLRVPGQKEAVGEFFVGSSDEKARVRRTFRRRTYVL